MPLEKIVKFIVDTHLPPKLSKYLVEAGFDSTHTTDFPEGHLLQDSEIIKIALEEDRIILTKDQDFMDNYLVNGSPPKVIMLKFGNIGNKELLRYFNSNQVNLVRLLNGGAEVILFSRESLIEYTSK